MENKHSQFTKNYFLATQAPEGIKINPETIGIVISCANNRFAQAVICARSISKFHPNAHFSIIIGDIVPNQNEFFAFLPRNSEIIETKNLNIPNFQSFAFQYTPYALCSNIKCFGVEYHLKKHPHEKIFYCDSDFIFFSPLNDAIKALDTSPIIITPHRTSPTIPYDAFQEKCIHQSGIFNAGFFGVRASSKEAKDFLNWWQGRTLRDGQHCIEEGCFVDQKWLDQLPAIFPQTAVFRHPGYNVAHWNLDERICDFSKNQPTVNGSPLCCIHFSSINLEEGTPYLQNLPLNKITLLKFTKQLGFLMEPYRAAVSELLKAPGMPGLKTPNAYQQFSDGKKILNSHREAFRTITPWPHFPENPFSMTRQAFEKAIRPFQKKQRQQQRKEAIVQITQKYKNKWKRFKQKHLGLK
jgi:hypothetical protein